MSEEQVIELMRECRLDELKSTISMIESVENIKIETVKMIINDKIKALEEKLTK